MTENQRPIGIISALPKELALLRAATRLTQARTLGGFEIELGTLDGTPVALALSVPGKVNAASLSTLMAEVLNCRALLFSGVAGGLNPQHAVLDIIIAERLVQHDYGAIKRGAVTVYRPGAYTIGPVVDPIDFRLARDLRDKLGRIKGIKLGTVLTGDLFINCEATRQRLHVDLGGDAVEMEGGAMAQVAERYNIPWVVIRALSDLAGDDSDIDFDAFATQAAEKAAVVARQALRYL